MAFSKTPAISTFQTKMLSLLSEMNSRGSTVAKDVDYLNIYPEILKNKVTQEQQFTLRKRSGCTSLATLTNTLTRGVYYWEDQAKLYVAQSDDIYIYSMPAGTLSTTLSTVFPTTTTGAVGFTEFLYDDGSVKLVVTDGTTLSTIDSSNTVVACVDADMPVHLPQPIYLDGFLFLVKTGTADLYNSDLNDPLAYTTSNFISSEMFPDRVSALVKLNNYIVLFGSDSLEYFWNAANETGSPLQRNDTPIKLSGLIGGIAQLGNKIYFLGDANKSEAVIYVIEDFKITPISSEPIRRFFTGAVATTPYAAIVSTDGHDFYVLQYGGYTYTLDIDSGLRHRWGFGSTTSFDMHFAVNCRTSTSYTPVFIRYNVATLYKFSPTLYQDNGSSMSGVIILDNEEFETHKQKTMANLVIWADKPTATNSVLVEWSDDDYQTYNTGISVDLYQEQPVIRRLGRFRRRAFKLTHTANMPLRIKAIEVDINMGQS